MPMKTDAPYTETEAESALKSWGGKRPNQTGRPPKPEAEKLKPRLIGFTDEDWKFIQKLAKEQGVSCAEVVRNGFNWYVGYWHK